MFMLIMAAVFPLACGLIVPLLKNIQSRKAKLSLVLAMQVIETVFCALIIFSEAMSTGVIKITDVITLGFSSDMLAKFFLGIICIGWLLVLLYACVYMKHEKNEERFFSFMLLSEGAMVGAALSSGLVSMYVFYEFVTLFSAPLVIHSLSKESVAAAKKYLYYSVAGAFAALFGIFVLAGECSLDFSAGGNLESASPLVLSAVFVMCIGFGAKAGMFPLHGWLPTAHPVAPAPASALLSAIIAKAGVLAIIRTVFFTVGAKVLFGTWVQTALLCLCLLTVLMGSMMAYREKVFKKRLAYSTVSQISYVLCGLFLFTESGVEGALLQILFHAIVKVGLFLCCGAVIYLYGKTTVDEIHGMGRKMPVTFFCFTLLSLSLIGIPPTGGFISKWYLASASLEASMGVFSWLVPAVLLASALLTAGYLLSISIHAFFPSEGSAQTMEIRKEPVLMLIPIVLLAVLSLAGGLFAAPVTEFIGRIASSVM
ncbi:MAG: proton-conducting membrane transporter [Ruminococcaceae bacterium]|nr:proton-conducting membrane transporter [Oscillospiraceae bacterium]